MVKVRPGRPKGTAVTSDGRYAVVSGGPRLDPGAPASGTVWVIDITSQARGRRDGDRGRQRSLWPSDPRTRLSGDPGSLDQQLGGGPVPD